MQTAASVIHYLRHLMRAPGASATQVGSHVARRRNDGSHGRLPCCSTPIDTMTDVAAPKEPMKHWTLHGEHGEKATASDLLVQRLPLKSES